MDLLKDLAVLVMKFATAEKETGMTEASATQPIHNKTTRTS